MCVFSVSNPPSFIYWVDFEMFNTVHYLVLNAVEVLLTVFQNQVSQMPCQITPQTQSDQSEAVSEEHVENKVGLFFITYFSKVT